MEDFETVHDCDYTEEGKRNVDGLVSPDLDDDLSSLVRKEVRSELFTEILSRQEAQDERLGQILQRLQIVEEGQGEMKEQVVRLVRDHEALTMANDQINRLGEVHWEEHIVTPMVTQLFPVFDMVLEFRSAGGREGGGTDKVAESAFKAIQAMLQEFLRTYGVEYFLSQAGGKFNPAFMKAVKQVVTSDSSLDKRVQACLQAGFKRGGRVLRPSGVSIWRYEETTPAPEQCTEERSVNL